MPFKFEKLEVWQLALDYNDLICEIAGRLPRSEEHDLKSQITRAATSVALNIAEGSTGQTDAEQARFLGLAVRSLLETVACQHINYRRKFLQEVTRLRQAYRQAETLVAKLHTMRKAIAPQQAWLREEAMAYEVGDEGRVTEAAGHGTDYDAPFF
jgi:four helix bundle protein